jgi:small subunit ribosomal protein S3Ae
MSVKQPAVKKRIKNWYNIHAPVFLNEAILGESNVYAKNELIGKTIKLNLFAFTNDIKKQNMDAIFRVTNVVENKALTEILGIILTQSYIKRLVRRGRNKIDDSFLVKTKDRKLIRVKPLLVTNNKTNKSVTSKIRLITRDYTRKLAATVTNEELFSMIVNVKLQKELREKLNKVYPLKFSEIRQAVIEKHDVNENEQLPEDKPIEYPETPTEEEEIFEGTDEDAAEKPSTENNEDGGDGKEDVQQPDQQDEYVEE